MNKGCNSKSLYTLYVLVKLKKTAFDYDGRTILIARIESCTKKQCCYSIQKHFKQPLKLPHGQVRDSIIIIAITTIYMAQ